MARQLIDVYETFCYRPGDNPDADVVIIVKHAPPLHWIERVASHAAVVFCPVDRYGSAAEIDSDYQLLRRCARIVVHCQRLQRYFGAYAPVLYMDHHVKFATLPRDYRSDGCILWVGVRTNLPPLVEWVNIHPPPAELLVLTNLEEPNRFTSPTDFGFRPGLNVRIENWSPQRHAEGIARARAALDIKGTDFRSRNKPPAKAIDFLASGLPLAMNHDSSPVEHLASLGFHVPPPLDVEHWLSRSYWEETLRFGRALGELLSRERVGRRYQQMIDEILTECHIARKGIP